MLYYHKSLLRNLINFLLTSRGGYIRSWFSHLFHYPYNDGSPIYRARDDINVMVQ